jgi:ribonucleoside-diphosphate reductase beta chain
MSLIKQHGALPVYKEASGFKYPWAIEYYDAHDQMVWHKSEYTLSQDIQDYGKDTEESRDRLTKIMRLFVQNDVMAGTGYDILLRIMKPTEIRMMLASFNDRESTHVFNYANFTDTLGLPDSVYTEFLDIPVMSSKTEYLEKAKVRKYEDYRAMGLSDAEVDREFRRAVARMLAVYAGGLEGIALMAQFAMLLEYQFKGMYPGLCTIVEWSIKDEQFHLKGNAKLFRTFIQENPDIWDDELKYDIYEAIREVVSYEHALIEYLGADAKFKRYVEYTADNALSELGMKKNWNTPNELLYMDDVVGAQLTDFFSGSVTEYSKTIEGSWQEVNYDKWK